MKPFITKHVKGGREGGREKYEFAMKIDMSKAYDRLEWDFIEVVLLKFDFYG